MTTMDFVAGTDVATAPTLIDADLLRSIETVGFGSSGSLFLPAMVGAPGGLVTGVRVHALVRRVTGGRFWLAGGILRGHVSVDLEVSAPGEYTATQPDTGIFGVGESPVAAVEDLRAALVDHRDTLLESGELSADLQRQLKFLTVALQPAEPPGAAEGL